MRYLLIPLTLMMLTTPASARADDDPKAIIEKSTTSIRELVLKSTNEEEMRKNLEGLLEEFVDFDEFGKLCLGKRWTELTAQQHKSYLAEFRILLKRTYLKRFKAGKDFKVNFNGDAKYNKKKDRAEVKTVIISGEVEADVDYRFHPNVGWKVYDIVVDDVSMRRNYRKSFVKVLKKDGFDALLDKMRKKNLDELEKTDEEETN
jgi:phospholipid transport system substrate-binding protein